MIKWDDPAGHILKGDIQIYKRRPIFSQEINEEQLLHIQPQVYKTINFNNTKSYYFRRSTFKEKWYPHEVIEVFN